jgi:hypothetical protein
MEVKLFKPEIAPRIPFSGCGSASQFRSGMPENDYQRRWSS